MISVVRVWCTLGFGLLSLVVFSASLSRVCGGSGLAFASLAPAPMASARRCPNQKKEGKANTVAASQGAGTGAHGAPEFERLRSDGGQPSRTRRDEGRSSGARRLWETTDVETREARRQPSIPPRPDAHRHRSSPPGAQVEWELQVRRLQRRPPHAPTKLRRKRISEKSVKKQVS